MSTDTPKAPAFVLGAALPVFTWTVRVPIPADDTYRHAELPLIFQAVDQAELDRMEGIGLAAGERPPTDTEIARRVIIGWPLLQAADGSSVLFSPDALERLLQAPLVRTAAVATYLAAMKGMAARKNG